MWEVTDAWEEPRGYGVIWCFVMKVSSIYECEAPCGGVGQQDVGQCMYCLVVAVGAEVVNVFICAT